MCNSVLLALNSIFMLTQQGIGYRCLSILLLKRALCTASLAYAAGLSLFSAHQEIRFLLPCLPFLHITAGAVLCDVLAWCYSDSHRYLC